MTRRKPEHSPACEGELYRLLAENVEDYAIFILDPEGRVQSWTPGAERLLGYREEEILGQAVEVIFTPEDVQDKVPQQELEQALITGRGEDDRWHVRSDGSRFWGTGVMTPLWDEAGNLRGFAKIVRDRTEWKQAERARLESEASKAAVLQTALDGIVTIDHEDRIVEFNPAAENLFGYRRSEALGQKMAELILPAHLRPHHYRGLKRYLATGEGTVLGKRMELTALRADGTEFPVELAIVRVPTEEAVHFTGYIRDITARKKQEQRRAAQLAVTEVLAQAPTVGEAATRILERICENLGWDVGAFWTVDEQANVLRCQQTWQSPPAQAADFEKHCFEITFEPGGGLPGRVWSTRRAHWIADVLEDGAFPRLASASESGLHAAFAVPLTFGRQVLGVIEFLSNRIEKPDPDLLDVMATVGGQIGQYMQRKRAEASLRASEGRFRDLMEQAPFSVQILSPSGETLQVNRAWERLWGARFEDLRDYNILEDPQLRAKGVHPFLQRAFSGEAVAIPAIEYDPDETLPGRTRHKDSRRWVSAVAYPLKDHRGQVREVVLAHHDMTDRKRAEEALRASEERFRGIVSRSIAGVAEVDLTGRFLFANKRYCEIVGRSLEELRGLKMQDISHKDDLKKNVPLFERIARDAKPYTIEKRYIRPDGSHVWVNNSVSGLRGADGRVTSVVAVGVDVTDRRRAEEALRRAHHDLEQRVIERTAELSHTNRFLRALLESIHDGIVACNAQGELTFFNRAATEFHVLPQQASPLDGWLTHRDLYQPDGSAVAPEDAPLLRALNGETVDSVEVIVAPQDGIARTLLASGRPFFDDQGEKLGAVVSMRDITERKEAENALRRAHEELEQRVAERTAELAQANDALVDADRRKDEFLAMLAHELRNPLAPIRSGLELLTLMDNGEQVIETMQQQVDHLVRLVDDLLDVSRIMRGKIDLRREPVDLATVAARAVETVRPTIHSLGHHLELDLPSEPVWLSADPIRLSQVVSNLLNNAAKYTPGGGCIELTAQRQGEVAVLRIRDTGMGIDQELLPHVFELFRQGERGIDRSDGGLGIGLTLVKNLTEMHGGSVSVTSDGAGRGSEFTVTLPALAQPRLGGGEAAQKPVSRYRILVVDRHVPAAKMTRILLKKLGDHHLSLAHNGSAAIDMAKQHRPEVILLDLELPDLDGHEVARRLRRDPQLKRTLIVALSDRDTEEDRQKSREAGCDQYLVKPLGVDALKLILAPRPDDPC